MPATVTAQLAGNGLRQPTATRARLAAAAAMLAVLGLSETVWAVDGCLVLLCLAAPSWREIPECVPPMHELFHDLHRGRRFPRCDISGAGNGADNQWASAPDFCPKQYTLAIDGENGPSYMCGYTGAISVSIDGAPFTRTWWNADGDSVTEYSPAAKAQLGTWDTRFDEDYARWSGVLPAPAPMTP